MLVWNAGVDAGVLVWNAGVDAGVLVWNAGVELDAGNKKFKIFIFLCSNVLPHCFCD